MTLYDLTKEYGKGRGEETMWASVQVISDFVEKHMAEEEKEALMREVYSVVADGHYNEDFAREDIEKMFFVDRAGTKHPAPYWPEEAVREIYNSVKGEINPYNFCDFNVTMNMVASDNWPLLEKWFPGMREDDRNQKTVEMALNFLKDPDAKNPDTKIWDYMKK